MVVMSREPSPYVELERAAWAALADEVTLPLDPGEVERLRGLGDEMDLAEVRDVYLPVTELLSLRVRAADDLHHATERFLKIRQPRHVPYVIGVAGSVAVGKSTIARLLRELLSRSPEHPSVELVTTDGFLHPNAELERRGILDRKGFPESYDRRALLRFVMELKSGVEVVTAPTYSHLTYDRTDEVVTIRQPDIVIIEGLNVLGSAKPRPDGSPGVAIRDFFDFSIFIDASGRDIKRWYTDRFLKLRQTAFADPQSYFHRYATFTDDEAVERAEHLWNTINGPNLKENIQSTTSRATLVLRKDSDHSVKWVRLRKI